MRVFFALLLLALGFILAIPAYDYIGIGSLLIIALFASLCMAVMK